MNLTATIQTIIKKDSKPLILQIDDDEYVNIKCRLVQVEVFRNEQKEIVFDNVET